MGGQMMGGGIIVLVAVVLWLVYLLPSWYSRRQFDAVERNAVRLNQALRVLAETSQTPEEVRLELTARTAAAQRKLARRAQSEREESARRSQKERDRLARQAQEERDRLARQVQEERDEAAATVQRTELEQARIELQRARAQRAALARTPQQRQARARRRTRLTLTVLALAGAALAGWGVVIAVLGGTVLGGVFTDGMALVWSGIAVMLCAAMLLVRLARVSARAAIRASLPAAPAEASAPRVVQPAQDFAIGPDRTWSPRPLPQPMTAAAGSQAAAARDRADARERLRQAALDEALRARAEHGRPPQLDTVRAARAGQLEDGQAGDAEIEAHVRDMLRRRAAG